MSLLDAADQGMILAAGSNIDSGGLEGLIEESGDAIKTWGGIIIGVVATIFVIARAVAAITAFSNKNMSDGVKEVVKAVIIVIIAIMGIGGLFTLVDSINPVQNGTGVTSYLEGK